jgi:hypothetical protein
LFFSGALFRIFHIFVIINPTPIKKIFSIFLVFVLAFNSCGLPFFYWAKIQVCKIKAEIAERSGAWSSGPLVVFSSADKDVRLENSRELRVSGEMYDIVKTETRNGVKFYYATHDNDEDIDIAKLANSEKKSSHETSLPVKAQTVYDAVFFAIDNSDAFNSYPAVVMRDEVSVNGPNFYPDGFKEIFSPPPNGSFS